MDTHDVQNARPFFSLCGLRSCLSCGTCTAFVCCTDTFRIQAITAEELDSRCASEWETDHLPFVTMSSMIVHPVS